MGPMAISEATTLILLLAFAVTLASSAPVPACPAPSVAELVLRRQDFCSNFGYRAVMDGERFGVVEGDEAALLRALNFVHRNKGDYVAMVFYASWCPFSKICRPNFQMLASLFPTVRHFAFEESMIRPSILSRYGVHGFPTLFLLNSTMRVRYHGPRTMRSLVAFYNSVTGVNPALLDEISVEKIVDPRADVDLAEGIEQENRPFFWTRLPEKLLQQDSYLALAICFLVVRLLHLLVPKLNACVKRTWMRQIHYASLTSLCDNLYLYVEQAKQIFSRLKPCKRNNFQEGAINATEWASKSLASVSLGEPSNGKVYIGGKW